MKKSCDLARPKVRISHDRRLGGDLERSHFGKAPLGVSQRPSRDPCEARTLRSTYLMAGWTMPRPRLLGESPVCTGKSVRRFVAPNKLEGDVE